MAPRIPPLAPRDWPPAMRGALAAIVPPEPRHPLPVRNPDRPQGHNVLGTLAHHPALATAFHTFNGHLQFATTLTTRQRELLVLRLAAVRGSEYEWRQHVVLAGDVGLTPEEVERIRQGGDAPGWDPLEAAMLRAVDELVADGCIGDATWAELAPALDAQQLLDLIFTVGCYEVLAMALASFGVELDADLQERK